jgi:Meiotically up-regulated gene 113
MEEKHTVIYVMRHIDIGGYIEIPYKKIGITGHGNATLDSRLQQISNTKSPIKAQCVAAWSHGNARALENALHLLLEDSRVEGEWFLDKNDTLVERLKPMMLLIGASEIEIEESKDAYTQSVLKTEREEKQKSDHILLGEISDLLNSALRTSSRKSGPTFFSDKRQLTFYVSARKSGRHNLYIGRSKDVYGELSSFLSEHGYDVDQGDGGGVQLLGITSEVIAQLIDLVENKFEG